MRTQARPRFMFLGTVLLAFLAGGCDPSAGSGPADTSSGKDTGPVSGLNALKAQLLSDAATGVMLPALAAFVVEATALKVATQGHAAVPTAATLVAAQDAWRSAMAAWERLEVMQVGPAGVMGEVLGGDDRRDGIYSWPLTNPCRVDQETLETAYATPVDLAQESVNVRGLDAVEYLLFHPAEGNACKVNSGINQEGTWVAMGSELLPRQARYAASAASLILEEALALQARWSPTGGDFSAQLQNAGSQSSTYPSQQEALNALSNALFYIEKVTKDMKLGEPLGLIGCDTDTCPEALESPWAHASKEAVLANIDGVKWLLEGGIDGAPGTGFIDLLEAVGAADLAGEMVTKLAAARAAVSAVEGTFAAALVSDQPAMDGAFNALKDFTDLFKTQFLSVLDLAIPSRAASDND